MSVGCLFFLLSVVSKPSDQQFPKEFMSKVLNACPMNLICSSSSFLEGTLWAHMLVFHCRCHCFLQAAEYGYERDLLSMHALLGSQLFAFAWPVCHIHSLACCMCEVFYGFDDVFHVCPRLLLKGVGVCTLTILAVNLLIQCLFSPSLLQYFGCWCVYVPVLL